MKLNNPLSNKQKFEIFINLPGVKVGGLLFLIGTLFICSLIMRGSGKDITGIVVLTSIFPLIGLSIIYPSVRALPRIIYALENGVCVEGKLISITNTNTKFNDKYLKNVTLSYQLYGQIYTITEKMIISVKDLQQHLIMVDASDPNNAVYLETLPFDVKKKLKRRNQF